LRCWTARRKADEKAHLNPSAGLIFIKQYLARPVGEIFPDLAFKHEDLFTSGYDGYED
jgi:hypothetical protein